MMYLGGWDDFGVLNGHAIIGDWVAWSGESGLKYGQITSFREIGKLDSGHPEDVMVINDREAEISPNIRGGYRYPVVKITSPCVYHCCDPSQCRLKDCKCREGKPIL